MGTLGIQINNNSNLENAKNSVIDTEVSILQKQIIGYWCCNCYYFVESDDIFVSKRHRAYLYRKFEQIEPPKKDYLACICKDCVYYRLQKCSQCGKGSPLCMYPISHWFEASGRNRKCIDCTAITDTKKILGSLTNLCPSQCILQCNMCCRYKYVCSFSVFSQAYGEDATKIVKEMDMTKDHKLYKRTVCFECRMNDDIALHGMMLQKRYLSKISDEPSLLSSGQPTITASKSKEKQFNVLSYANVVSGVEESSFQHKIDVKSVLEEAQKQSIVAKDNNNGGPSFIVSTMQGTSFNHNRFLNYILVDAIFRKNNLYNNNNNIFFSS